MNLASIMTLNLIRETCEMKAKESKDEFYLWVAETLRRVVVNDPAEEIINDLVEKSEVEKSEIANFKKWSEPHLGKKLYPDLFKEF